MCVQGGAEVALGGVESNCHDDGCCWVVLSAADDNVVPGDTRYFWEELGVAVG